MTLLAFCDESLRPERDLVSVAGYLFYPEEYAAFEKNWECVTNVTKGAPLHMTHLVNGKREFEALPLRSRVLATEVAVDLINRHALTGLSMTISREEFRKILPTDEWQKRLGSLYSLLCKIQIETGGRWLNDKGIDERISWSFGAGHEARAEAELILGGVRDDAGLDWAKTNRVDGYAFVGGSSPGLQAADLLAWSGTLALTMTVIRDRAKLQPFIDEVARLDAKGKYETRTISGDGLGRLIDLNLSNPEKRIYKIPALAKLATKL